MVETLSLVDNWSGGRGGGRGGMCESERARGRNGVNERVMQD